MNLRRKLLRKAGPEKGEPPWVAIDEEDEDLLFSEILKRHPQYRRAYERGEKVWENGQEVNPALHLRMHVVVENQIRDGNPAFVREAALALEQAGMHSHEVRHRLAVPVLNQVLGVLKQEVSYDEEEHRARVEELVRQHLPRR